MPHTAYTLVLVTAPKKGEAEKIAELLVASKLAACVNIIGGVASTYWWQGKVETSEEQLLLIKSRSNLIPELTTVIRQNHSYSVPEVLCLPVVDGNPAYLDWIGANTLFSQPKDLRRKERDAA